MTTHTSGTFAGPRVGEVRLPLELIVDSNVLLDIITDDPTLGACSSDTLERLADEAILVINAPIYAEVSIGPTLELIASRWLKGGAQPGN